MKYFNYAIGRYIRLIKENALYVFYGLIIVYIILMWNVKQVRTVYYMGMPYTVADTLRELDFFRMRIMLEAPIFLITMMKISKDTYQSTNIMQLRDFRKVWISQILKCFGNAVFLAFLFLAAGLVTNMGNFDHFVNFSEMNSIFAKEMFGKVVSGVTPFEVVWKYLVVKIITFMVLSLVFSILNIFLDLKKTVFCSFLIHIFECYFYKGFLTKIGFVFSYQLFLDNIVPMLELCVLLIIALSSLGYLLVTKKDVFE